MYLVNVRVNLFAFAFTMIRATASAIVRNTTDADMPRTRETAPGLPVEVVFPREQNYEKGFTLSLIILQYH